MALQKTFNLPSGPTGNYLRISAYRWDRNTREASALISLFSDSTKPRALVDVFAKVRISGADFDTYHAASTANGSNQIEQLYEAAKAGFVVCDLGSDALKDAQDV